MKTERKAMKRLLFVALGTILMVPAGAGVAFADNGPHMSSASTGNATVVVANAGAGKCASCHRAHTAQAEFLLKQAQPALCYTCHAAGMGAATDVRNGQDWVSSGALRGGGFDFAAINSGNASKVLGAADPATGRIATSGQTIPALTNPVVTTSKHQIDGETSGTAWGNGPIGSGLGQSLTLECGSCHDPHGNGNYRILKPMPVDSQWVVTPAVIADPTAVPPVVAVAAVLSPPTTVNIPDATTKVYTTANYWLAGDLNVPAGGAALTGTKKATDPAGDGYIQNISSWCTTCHTRYLAPTQSYKTSSNDPVFTYRHRSDANYKAGAANCITCHVSHGSNASVSGSADVPLPGGAVAPVGDSRLLRVDNRGTCVMCHNV
jgi:predicted CXXCH cytochrome family protein